RPDVHHRNAPTVTDHRRYRKGEKSIAPRFYPDDRFASLVGCNDRCAAKRDVVSKCLWIMNAKEDGCRWPGQDHCRETLCLKRLHWNMKQALQAFSIALLYGVAYRRQPGDDGAHGQCRAPLIVEDSDDAIILHFELMIEREPCQRTLL